MTIIHEFVVPTNEHTHIKCYMCNLKTIEHNRCLRHNIFIIQSNLIIG